MGIIRWFKTKPHEETAAAPPPERDVGALVAGLDFKSAIGAHMMWKIRLKSYIHGTSEEDLKVDTVCRDDQCPLGQWIYSRGNQEFGYSETFFDMKAHHANFHRCAGDVLRLAQSGHKDQALHLLQRGDYVLASERVKKLLAKLFVLATDGKAAIDVHQQWKERLRDQVLGHAGEVLDVETVGRDDLCTLGAWLQKEGRAHYGNSPAFAALIAEHQRFHAAAGAILALACSGQSEEALRQLDSDQSDYALASDNIAAAIVDLFSGGKI